MILVSIIFFQYQVTVENNGCTMEHSGCTPIFKREFKLISFICDSKHPLNLCSILKYKVAFALIISPLALRLLRVRDLEGAEGGASWNERRDALDMMKIFS